jgi:hypothetical protein
VPLAGVLHDLGRSSFEARPQEGASTSEGVNLLCASAVCIADADAIVIPCDQ